jgi:putative transcriptional regulator
MKITQKTLNAVHELLAHERGEKTAVRATSVSADDIDVRVIRENLRLSQKEFADLYRFPLGTIQNWEQGRRQPEGAARLLLKLIAAKPDLVAQELHRHKAEIS